MTKRAIETIIKDSNENKAIKWNVLENNKDEIVLGNDYDTQIRYEINLNAGEDGKDISVTDETHSGMTSGVCYLLFGTESYADFTDANKGAEIAIKAAVRHFNYYY